MHFYLTEQYQVDVRYTGGKTETLAPQVHIIPPVDSIPNSTAWATIAKNYSVRQIQPKFLVSIINFLFLN